MKYFSISLQTCLFALLASLQTGFAAAQSSCSSDGLRPVQQLTERFISADCLDCWTAPLAMPHVAKAGLILDWIVPSAAGDDAVMSAAANRDASMRLEALNRPFDGKQMLHSTTPQSLVGYKLRVAHGLPVNGYIGTSIEWTPNPRSTLGAKTPRPLTSYLLLLEFIPKGTADSPMDRLLVRNMIQEGWNLTTEPKFLSRRPMSIPAGANPDNLRVLGWVQNANGQVLSVAQSHCAPSN
jgi:hypothetical protein